MVAPPVPERRPQPRVHHGDVFEDPYEWLRETEDAEVIRHLESENIYTDAMTAHLADLRQDLFDDIAVRTQQTDLSVPSFHSHSDQTSWWYYARTVTDLDYPIYCRAPAHSRDEPPQLGGDPDDQLPGEQILLDANLEAAGHPFFSLGAMSVSPNGQTVAFSVDHSGDERYDAYLRVIGGETTPAMTGIGSGLAWAGDGHLVYARVDEAWRPHEVWLHEVGSGAADTLIFSEPDERFWVDASESRDRRWVVIHSGARLTSSAWLLDANNPTGPLQTAFARREGVDASIEICGGEVFVLHNSTSPDFQVSRAPLVPGPGEAAAADTWRDFVGPDPGVRYTGVDAYDSHVVVARREAGLAGLTVLSRHDATPAPPITFGEAVYEASPMGEEDHDTDRIRISYQSLVTPPSVMEYVFATAQLRTLKTMPVLPHPSHGAYQRDDYITERAWAPAADGTQIPLSIVRPADVRLDGSAPCLLYGYGSYEISIPPSFSISRLSLLDRGFVFVIAHVRGGGEMGRAWYEQGRLMAKENTFTDFVAAARWLIEAGYTSPDRLVAEGRSAGGLLMGAITNLAPDLFAGVHAGVAFVDALTTILDPSLPLTVTEWEEWGDPLHDAQVYRYMKGYTPYENITAVPYPTILATTSLNDTRVSYVEPTKWVAELRHTTTGPAPILLKTEMDAGHGGVSGRYQQWHERAFELAWIIDVATSAPIDA